MTDKAVLAVAAALAAAAIAFVLTMWRRVAVAAPAAALPATPQPLPVEPIAPPPQVGRVTEAESLVIDPVAMNIPNRVAPGCKHAGTFHWHGGLMIEGTVEGTIHVTGGPIVLMPEGVVAGVITGDSEAYLFGTIRPRSEAELSELDVAGAVFLTETLQAKANITAGAIKSYDGAQVEGRIKTLKRGS